MKKKRVVQIFVIAALLVIILGSFLVKKGFIYMPSPGDIAFRPYKSLMSIFKRTPRENDNRFSNVMVNPPNITQYYDDGSGNVVESKPDPITFYFYESAAKLEMLDKDVTGIKMSPEAEGVWRWADEHSLVFYPKNDWPAGEKYKIKFPKDIFSPSFALSEYSYTVATPDFSASLNNFQLYQDPKNPKIRQLQASFSFTHAVDTKYFEKNLSLKIDKKDFPFKVTYDKLKRNAFIVSDPVSILTKDQVAVIELSSARAAAGGKDMRDKIKQAYGIPSQDKFFRIANVDAIIVNNDQEEPEQFISLEFTDGVDAKQLQGKVEAYLLPMLNPDTNKQQNDRIEVTGGDKDSGDGGDGDYGEEGTRDRIVRPYSYQWSFSEVTPAVLNKSKKLDLKQMDNASDISGVYMFKYNAPDMANRYVYVKINEGIVSQTDFAIKKPFSTLVTSAGFPKQVSLLQNGAILPLDGSRMLTFKTRGVSGVKVDIARVMPSQINHLISQTYSYGSFAHPGFKNEYDFNEYNISQCFSKVIPLNISIEKANYSTVDMNEFLKSQGASGLFFVKIKGYTPSTNTDEGVSDSRFILATDMGILAKKDYTKKYNVFVMSIKSGRPVAGAKVDVLGKNGIPVLTQYTDEQGCAVFNKIDGFQYEKQPVAYIVTKGDDTSFMPFNSSDRAVDYSKFDTGGEFASENKSRGIKAFVFSDRGIYRPGDDINLGIIVRNSDWSDISGIPVKVVLKDPFSKTVFEKTATLNATGFLTVDGIKTYNVSPTGTYSASVYLIKDDKSEFLLGSASVTVQEFRTDTIKVSAKITGAAGSGWTLPENLKTLVTVNNFFGTPAQNRNVKASYALSPTEFTFPKYAGFRFPDPYRLNTRNAVQSQSENFADAKTDENGEASFAFDLSKYSGGTYNLTFSAEAFEGDSGKSVFTYDSVKVSPYKYLLGYKTTSKLEYLNKGASSTLNIVAVDNDLKGVTLKDLKLRVKQIQYISSLVKQDNGVYKFQSVAKETVISEKPLNISADGISAGGSALSLNTENPGTFVLEIEDGQGMKILNIQYFVAGSSNQSFTIEKDANLTINLESNEVAPGNQLTLNITAPYTGAGLITIEKDKVYAYKWFQTDTNSSVQRITVPENLEGNAYVNVSFIRSINSKEIFSSPHSYAVVPFKVNMAKRKAVISLQTPEMIRPGEELEISYKTSQNSKIVVYAVDQGILQVAGYTTPNPLAFFFAKGALQVQTFQTVDMILPDYKIIREIAGIGGGEGYDMIAKNLNPFARKQAKPVVFWSSTLEATTEYQKVKFKVPDYFNGQLKVMAVAANPQQAGSADKDVIVKSQVIIMPVAPLAAITGDTFEVTATVSNNIEGSKSAALDVWLETNKKFEITGTNKQTIEVKEGGEKIVRFTLKTLDSLGSGDIVFKAQHKQDIYKSEVSVSVRPAFAYQTMIKSGVSKKAKTEISGFARDMYDEFANREITASYNPQLIFFSLKSYFSKYPYGCTEQIVSAAFPFIYPATSNRKGFITADEQQAMFNNALSKVRLRQLSSGGFALWPNSSDIDNYVSVYALHFFTDAKELDYPAPNEILAAGKNWLQYFASELPRSMEDARLKAYANYVLTRNGYITTNNLLMLEDYLNSNQKKWQKDIISAYMASCYSLLRDFKKADALIKSYVPETKDKFIFYSDFDSSSQRNAIYLYLCNKHFAQNLNPDAQAIADGLVQIIMDGKYNTISSAHILLALLSYGVSMEGKDAGITISAKGKDGKEKQLTLNADPFPYSKFSSDVSGFTVNSDADTGRVYYSVIQQGFDRTLKEYANGLELMREYIDANGAVVKSAKLGDTLTARIRVKNKSYDYVSLVIVDLLPAAFEIISGTQSGSFSSVDAREDRMIFFATVGKSITELTYQVKVVTKGAFTVPGVYAAAMYDPEISAQTKTGTIEITQPADNGK